MCQGNTVAAAFVVREHESRLTRALEAAGGVGAGAKLADVGLHLALVDVWEGRMCERAHLRHNGRHTEGRLTYTLVVLHLVARRADAPEGSIQVLTGPRGAGTRQTHALVDICWNKGRVGLSRLCVSSKIRAALLFSD